MFSGGKLDLDLNKYKKLKNIPLLAFLIEEYTTYSLQELNILW